MPARCEVCDSPLARERIVTFLEVRGVLPTHCQGCSREERQVAYLDFAHKTGGEVVMATGGAENARRAEAVYRRRR